MTLAEALIVTLLGMGVVFLGLVLCIGGIQVFNRLATRIAWGEEGHGPSPAPEPAVQKPAVDPAPPDPEVLVAIAAALEIESRLYAMAGTHRLTIRRSPQP
jgi:Na+-transporting methylmalonyl-CoA/oxaloacetate decarboxylase gamma subunit